MIDLIPELMTTASAVPRISPNEKAVGNADDADYLALVARVQARFNDAVEDGHALFDTDADLWPVYLGAFPPELRQHHDCHACRHFLRTHGAIATINERGFLRSPLWYAADENADYKGVFAAMAAAVARARVTGVHISSAPVWGTPLTGRWTHLCVRPPDDRVYKGKVLTAGQAAAAKHEDHKNVMRALVEFSPELLAQALTLLESDALYRAEKVIGPVRFLADLHAAAKAGNRTNVVWRAISTAPAGFCHPRSSMAGTLLEDLASGLSFADVAAKFKAKMHPLQYQRPSAAPSAGQVKAAEDLVAKLGIASSLKRRFARLDECETTWRPTPADPVQSGDSVFGHLLPQNRLQKLDVPAQRVTWAKFVATALPDALGLEVKLGYRMNFGALITAADPAAPPILQWDREDARNPVSWYLYHGGSTPTQWGLSPHAWAKVNAVVSCPTKWRGGDYKHQGDRAFLIVEGARDSGSARAGGGLFPEILKSELHGARSVIEAYSRTAVIDGYTDASACGIVVGGGSTDDVHVRVAHRSGNRFEYVIDRWD